MLESLLLKYNNLRQNLVNSSKYIIYEEQEHSKKIATGARPSSSSRQSPQDVGNVRCNIARLRSEEQRAETGEDDGSQEDDDQNNDRENAPELEKNTEQEQQQNPTEDDDNHDIILQCAEADIRSIEEVKNAQSLYL